MRSKRGDHDGLSPGTRLMTDTKGAPDQAWQHGPTDLVFDFAGLHRPDLPALALILTARLQAGPDHTVWVRELPYATWRVLHALGLDHMFRHYPASSHEPN